MNTLTYTLMTGVGATLTMDAWSLARKKLLGVAAPNYGLVGRWLGHMTHGQFLHNAIATARAIPGEQFIGWAAHYVIGIAFAALLIGVWGQGWMQHPTLGPALLVGVGTVAAPFLLMQPGMGAGIAASRTARPGAARIQSLVTHTFFGLGLYLSGWLVHLAGFAN